MRWSELPQEYRELENTFYTPEGEPIKVAHNEDYIVNRFKWVLTPQGWNFWAECNHAQIAANLPPIPNNVSAEYYFKSTGKPYPGLWQNHEVFKFAEQYHEAMSKGFAIKKSLTRKDLIELCDKNIALSAVKFDYDIDRIVPHVSQVSRLLSLLRADCGYRIIGNDDSSTDTILIQVVYPNGDVENFGVMSNLK